jgi:hypothetical protein
MKIDFQKIIAKTTEIDKDLLPDSKNKTKRHAKIQVYEDQHGDVSWFAHNFFTLRITLGFTADQVLDGKPKYYRVGIDYHTTVHRRGNVGTKDAVLAVLYFISFVVAFRSELVAICILPYSIWRCFRARKVVRSREHATTLMFDIIDPLRLNRDAYFLSNMLVAFFGALLRFLYHVTSIILFFSLVTTSQPKRHHPYSYCDVDASIGQNGYSTGSTNHTDRSVLFDPWRSVSDPLQPANAIGFQRYQIGEGTLYTEAKSFLECPHPMYGKFDIWLAAALDAFFLPIDGLMQKMLLDMSNIMLMVSIFWITEEYEASLWLPRLLKRSMGRILNLYATFLGILMAVALLAYFRFGDYFEQFRTWGVGIVSIFSWAFGSPVTPLDNGVNMMSDDVSTTLVLYYIVLSLFVVTLLSNIFVTILMDAYGATQERGELIRFRFMPIIYVYKQNQLMVQSFLVSSFLGFFPHVRYVGHTEDKILMEAMKNKLQKLRNILKVSREKGGESTQSQAVKQKDGS